MFELWLVTRAHKISTKPPAHPDEAHGRVGKPHSTPGQDLAWIEAISAPDCQATDTYLRKALKELESWENEAHAALTRVYLAGNADEAIPEKWRRDAANTQIPIEKRSALVMSLHLLEDAFAFVLYRAHKDRMLFIWPSPERAKGMVKTNEAKKLEARYHYIQARERGDATASAVRHAYLAASCSERAVWKWRQDEGWDGLVEKREVEVVL